MSKDLKQIASATVASCAVDSQLLFTNYLNTNKRLLSSVISKILPTLFPQGAMVAEGETNKLKQHKVPLIKMGLVEDISDKKGRTKLKLTTKGINAKHFYDIYLDSVESASISKHDAKLLLELSGYFFTREYTFENYPQLNSELSISEVCCIFFDSLLANDSSKSKTLDSLRDSLLEAYNYLSIKDNETVVSREQKFLLNAVLLGQNIISENISLNEIYTCDDLLYIGGEDFSANTFANYFLILFLESYKYEQKEHMANNFLMKLLEKLELAFDSKETLSICLFLLKTTEMVTELDNFFEFKANNVIDEDIYIVEEDNAANNVIVKESIVRTPKDGNADKVKPKIIYEQNNKCLLEAVMGCEKSWAFNKAGINILDLHHVIPKSLYDNYNISCKDNYVCLCKNCHNFIHNEFDKNSQKYNKAIDIIVDKCGTFLSKEFGLENKEDLVNQLKLIYGVSSDE